MMTKHLLHQIQATPRAVCMHSMLLDAGCLCPALLTAFIAHPWGRPSTYQPKFQALCFLALSMAYTLSLESSCVHSYLRAKDTHLV